MAEYGRLLEGTIACAHEIREHFLAIATRGEYAGQVHFRPTDKGVTMVGLHPERPQRGRGGYRAEDLARNFPAEFKQYCVEIGQGRPTPEKELQSFLIAHAYRNDRQLDIIDGDEGLHFVTDEIPVATENGKVVCDLLALRVKGDTCMPVQIELKSARDMTRLITQLEDYSKIINTNLRTYERLYEALLGKPIRFAGPVEKWLVWPSPHGDGKLEPDPREQELHERGIGVVQYRRRGPEEFEFHAGVSLEAG